MQCIKLDYQGYFVEAVDGDFETLPDGITDHPLPVPSYRPRWNGMEWVEEAPKPDYPPQGGMTWKWDEINKAWHEIPIPVRTVPMEDELSQLKESLLDSLETQAALYEHNLTLEEEIRSTQETALLAVESAVGIYEMLMNGGTTHE